MIIKDKPPIEEVYASVFGEEDDIYHYGMPRRSGRYPYGSGKDPYQHSGDFLSRVEELRKQKFKYTDEDGKTYSGDTAIAKSMGLTSTQFRTQIGLAKDEQRALKVDYEPVVHVQAVKANKRKGTDSLQASAEETAKYEVKSADYMTADDERNLVVIKNLEYALAGTRQISYGGLLKQIKQDLKLEDVENGDLVHVGDEDYTKEQMEAAEEVVAKWDFNKQNYFIW